MSKDRNMQKIIQDEERRRTRTRRRLQGRRDTNADCKEVETQKEKMEWKTKEEIKEETGQDSPYIN